MVKEDTCFSYICPNKKDRCKEKDSKDEVEDDEVAIIKGGKKEDKAVIMKEVNCPDSGKGILY